MLVIDERNYSGTVMQADQVVEDQDFCNPEFIELEKLAECGINVADINKLKSSGITSIKSVIMFLYH